MVAQNLNKHAHTSFVHAWSEIFCFSLEKTKKNKQQGDFHVIVFFFLYKWQKYTLPCLEAISYL